MARRRDSSPASGAAGMWRCPRMLPRAIDSPRFRKVERFGALHVHHLRLRTGAGCDGELAAWLAQSYVQYGQRTWLAGTSRRR